MEKRFKQRTTTSRIAKPPYPQNTPRELGLAVEPSLLERQEPVWKPPCPGGAAAGRDTPGSGEKKEKGKNNRPKKEEKKVKRRKKKKRKKRK